MVRKIFPGAAVLSLEIRLVRVLSPTGTVFSVGCLIAPSYLRKALYLPHLHFRLVCHQPSQGRLFAARIDKRRCSRLDKVARVLSGTLVSVSSGTDSSSQGGHTGQSQEPRHRIGKLHLMFIDTESPRSFTSPHVRRRTSVMVVLYHCTACRPTGRMSLNMFWMP